MAMIETPRFGSQMSWKITVAPIFRPSSMPAAKPVMWPSGEQTSIVSVASRPKRPPSPMQQPISVLRQCITPFGEPVVPDVNISTAIRSAGIAPITPTGGGPRRSLPDSSACSKLSGPSPSTTMTCASLGRPDFKARAIAS